MNFLNPWQTRQAADVHCKQLLLGYQMHITQPELLLQTKQQKHSQLAGDCLSALVSYSAAGSWTQPCTCTRQQGYGRYGWCRQIG